MRKFFNGIALVGMLSTALTSYAQESKPSAESPKNQSQVESKEVSEQDGIKQLIGDYKIVAGQSKARTFWPSVSMALRFDSPKRR